MRFLDQKKQKGVGIKNYIFVNHNNFDTHT